MSLRSLYEKISEYSDFALIGRDFSAFDTDYSVLGFANSSDKTELVLLNFNCSKDDICCEDLTLRENIILEKKNNSDLSDDFSAIVIDGQRFDFSSVCGETLECCELTRSYIISEFMKLGWKSDRFFDAPLDSLFKANLLSALSFLLFYNTDLGQIPVFLIIIQAIANHEFIRNGKAGIIHMYLFLHPALRLIKKGTQTDVLWSSLL